MVLKNRTNRSMIAAGGVVNCQNEVPLRPLPEERMRGTVANRCPPTARGSGLRMRAVPNRARKWVFATPGGPYPDVTVRQWDVTNVKDHGEPDLRRYAITVSVSPAARAFM